MIPFFWWISVWVVVYVLFFVVVGPRSGHYVIAIGRELGQSGVVCAGRLEG